MKKFMHITAVMYIIMATDAMLFSTNQDARFRYLSRGIICFIGFYAILKHGCEKKFQNLICISVIMIVSMAVLGDITGGYVFKIILFMCGYFLAKYIHWEEFRKYYVEIMLFIAVFSLICFIFANRIAEINIFPVISNSADRYFKCLFFTNVSLTPDMYLSGRILLHRNYGPFWEPGVFQMYLNIAVLFSFFGSQKTDKRSVFRIIIFSMAVLTTFSAAGYVVLAVIMIGYLFKSGNYGIKAVFFVFVFVCLIIIIQIPEVVNFIYGKLSFSPSNKYSSDTRWYSIWSNLYISIRHPLGIGPNSLEIGMQEFKDMFEIYADFGNVNAFLEHFAVYGMIPGMYYAYGLWRFVKSFHENKIVSFMIYLTLLLMLFNEPVLYSLMFSLILYYDENKSGRRIYFSVSKMYRLNIPRGHERREFE